MGEIGVQRGYWLGQEVSQTRKREYSNRPLVPAAKLRCHLVVVVVPEVQQALWAAAAPFPSTCSTQNVSV